ncbi:hypothetical protein FKG94_13440 [Exilibacterium tricleocarpae]|uniref:Uncharacterized protein n=1 Tax=Exilibacterium tricleocarpae TaxID=2591008 RepID=A0A545TLI8_9GAMM|nr:hypothetical protein [Exilibacterium tricleocarpae]TQV78079.1 hypothetical protein FKG94_13440 [Exilibacterium tricleocarpae]
MIGDKRSLLVAALLVAMVLSGWQLYQSHRRQAVLQQQLLTLQAELEGLRGQLGTVQQELDSLEQSSVKGAIEEANSAILSGWEALLETVEGELSRAREALEKEPPPAVEAPPRLQSPDGTDRT